MESNIYHRQALNTEDIMLLSSKLQLTSRMNSGFDFQQDHTSPPVHADTSDRKKKNQDLKIKLLTSIRKLINGSIEETSLSLTSASARLSAPPILGGNRAAKEYSFSQSSAKSRAPPAGSLYGYHSANKTQPTAAVPLPLLSMRHYQSAMAKFMNNYDSRDVLLQSFIQKNEPMWTDERRSHRAQSTEQFQKNHSSGYVYSQTLKLLQARKEAENVKYRLPRYKPTTKEEFHNSPGSLSSSPSLHNSVSGADNFKTPIKLDVIIPCHTNTKCKYCDLYEDDSDHEHDPVNHNPIRQKPIEVTKTPQIKPADSTVSSTLNSVIASIEKRSKGGKLNTSKRSTRKSRPTKSAMRMSSFDSGLKSTLPDSLTTVSLTPSPIPYPDTLKNIQQKATPIKLNAMYSNKVKTDKFEVIGEGEDNSNTVNDTDGRNSPSKTILKSSTYRLQYTKSQNGNRGSMVTFADHLNLT